MRLKTFTPKYRLLHILSDFKRILIFLIIVYLLYFLFPDVKPVINRAFELPSINQLLTAMLLGLISFTISIFIQIFNSWKPDFKPNFPASVIFSVYLFFINAPVEEFLFRVVIQGLLIQVSGLPEISILVTAIIFGFYHVPLFGWSKMQALIATVGGLCFGTVYYLTGSFAAAWFVHGFADLGFIHESIGGYLVWSRIRNRELK